PGTGRVPPRASSDSEFYRGVIGEERDTDAPPFLRPRRRRRRRQAAHENLVDAPRQRLREAALPEQPVRLAFARSEVRVAGENGLLALALDDLRHRAELVVARCV